MKNFKAVFFITCIGALFGMLFLLISQYLTNQQVSNFLEAYMPQSDVAALYLFIVLSFATSLSLPRQVAAFSAGYILGMWQGILIATLAATLGCFITLTFARIFLHKKLNNKYPEQIAKLSRFFAHQTFIKTLIIRILPAGSNFITNMLAGVAQVPIKPYLLGSSVGFLPQMVVFSMAGNGVRLADEQQLLLSGVLFLLALLLSAALYYFNRRTRAEFS